MALDLAFLGKKAGPLTYGEWSLAGAGGIAIAYWYKKKYGGSSASNVANAYDPLGNSDVSGVGGVSTGTSGSSGTGSTSGYQSNGEWGSAAVAALIKAGVSPLKATQAIADYLAGAVLSSDEQALVGQAIGLIGNPPGGPLQIITTGTSTGSGTGSTGSTGTGTSGGYDGSYGGYVDNTPTVSDTYGSSAGTVDGGSITTSAPAVGGTYVVKSGDNWLTVAAKAGVSEEALLAVNAARGPSAMRIGETIYLPAGAHAIVSTNTTNTSSTGSTSSSSSSTPQIVGYYTVSSGDNWITVASRAGVSESALIGANPSKHGAAMYVGESVAIPSPGHVPATVTTTKNTSTPAKASYYTVKSGDNWITVAAKFGISEQSLLNLNSSRGSSALRIGESLRVS